jgi:hypothetical protein
LYRGFFVFVGGIVQTDDPANSELWRSFSVQRLLAMLAPPNNSMKPTLLATLAQPSKRMETSSLLKRSPA